MSNTWDCTSEDRSWFLLEFQLHDVGTHRVNPEKVLIVDIGTFRWTKYVGSRPVFQNDHHWHLQEFSSGREDAGQCHALTGLGQCVDAMNGSTQRSND